MDSLRKAALILLAGLVAAGVIVGLYFGYWAIARNGQTQRYQVNVNSQQYQAGLIAAERDRIAGYDASTNDAQKTQIASTFCAVYPQLNPPPPDLVMANARIC